MKMNSLLIIDGENLLHRAYHKFLGFKSTEGVPTGAIYGFLKILHSNIFRFKPEYVIVTFDNGRSKHRTNILPGYKTRPKKLGMDYESLQKQKKLIMKILRRLGVPYVFDKSFSNEWEADDYIAYLAKTFEGEVTILSSDKDFHQLISKRVKVMSPSKDQLITEVNCIKLTGYNPDQCVDWLSMVGDESDSIPGYRGIGEVKATALLKKYNCIEKFIMGDYKESRVNKQTLNEVMTKNRHLIDLNFFIRKYPMVKNIPIKYGKDEFINRKLVTMFNGYSLSSFQSTEFINTFKELSKWKVK